MFKSLRGFTLIELIAVVALIGILAGIAIPRILDIRNEAKNKAAVANAAVLQEAFERAKVQCDESGTTLTAVKAAGNDASAVSAALYAGSFMSKTVSDVVGSGTYPKIEFAGNGPAYTSAN